MPARIRYTVEEAHEQSAKRANGRVWQLLEKPDRTALEDEEMVLAAHASLYHWQFAGSGVHAQRGHWLLAHVYAVLEEPAPCMKHASRCMELTETHGSEMKDFDRAYAYEAAARAHALQGDVEKAKAYHDIATQAGEAISDPEDKTVFESDLSSGNWYGVI